MAALRYKDEHNKVGYLLKPTGSDYYHQIINFLRASHIRYALTHNHIIFDSLVKQFSSMATLRVPELGPPAIQATIDKTPYTITEDLVWSRLQLADDGGIDNLPIAEIYSGMDNLGYVTEGNLTFFKNKFSPQWSFLVHTLLYCLSPKSGSWDQFGSPFAVALICLSYGRCFNWSNYIFKGMVSNIGNAKKFLMYPRFLQTILGIETRITRQYKVLVFSSKIFANMRLNFEGHPMPLLPAMLFQAQVDEGVEKMHLWEILFISLHQGPLKLPLQKVHSLETELKDHKKLFKDVVGKLVKKVKAMEVKLKKRKMVVSDSDQEDGDNQDVDLDALHALANATVTIDSNIPSGGTLQIPTAIPSVSTASPPGVSTIPFGALNVPLDKGKSLMVKEDIPVRGRTFKQMQKDILGEQAAKRLHDKEQANLDRQRAELLRQRQEEVLDSAMYYNEANWLNIMAQVEANASLSKTLLGDDVSEDNFPARMATLIRKKKQALAEKLAKERQNRPMTQAQQRAYIRQYVKNQSSAIYTTGWSMAYVKSFTDDQLKEEFKKICRVQSNSQIQAFSRTLKRSGQVRSCVRRTFLQKVVVNEDSDDEVSPVWSALVGWEVIPTPLGDINALYHIDGSTKHFTTLRKILRDLQVLFDSQAGGKGSCVWQHQHLWEIRSWRLYTLSNIYVLETISGEVLYMFTDVSYPLSVKLMERMLTHKLEIDSDVMGNDMTTAEQLIQFIKNQLAATQASSV
nr:synaptobrevin, longin-like domain protein [Tanacetum cinerariifolium]